MYLVSVVARTKMYLVAKCKLSFLIRKLVLLCIRGTRSSANTVDKSCKSDFEFACFVSKLS